MNLRQPILVINFSRSDIVCDSLEAPVSTGHQVHENFGPFDTVLNSCTVYHNFLYSI